MHFRNLLAFFATVILGASSHSSDVITSVFPIVSPMGGDCAPVELRVIINKDLTPDTSSLLHNHLYNLTYSDGPNYFNFPVLMAINFLASATSAP